MNDASLLNYYWLFIILMIPVFLWVRYSTSVGKRSQKALAQRVEQLLKETSSPLFVCMYSEGGHGVLVIENDIVRFLNAKNEMLRLRKNEIVNIEYSDLGFCHVVTATDRHKFAYIHHAKDAKGVFTMVIGPAWRDDDAIATFVNTVKNAGLPLAKVDHTKLIFLPQIKI